MEIILIIIVLIVIFFVGGIILNGIEELIGWILATICDILGIKY